MVYFSNIQHIGARSEMICINWIILYCSEIFNLYLKGGDFGNGKKNEAMKVFWYNLVIYLEHIGARSEMVKSNVSLL